MLLRLTTAVLSLLLHGAVVGALVYTAPTGSRSLEIGSGDDVLRIEAGIALEDTVQVGDDIETIKSEQVVVLENSRAASEIVEVKEQQTPPQETPVEEVQTKMPPPEYMDVITSTAKEAEAEDTLPVTEPPPIEYAEADALPEKTPDPIENVDPKAVKLEAPEPIDLSKPEEVKDVKEIDPKPVELEVPEPIDLTKPEEVKDIEPQKQQLASVEQVKTADPIEIKTASSRQSGGDAAQSRRYLGSLYSHILRFKVYPKTRRVGTPVVRYTIDADGNLLSTEIKKSSGSSVLDQAALESVARAAPFPAFPEGFTKKKFVVTQPFKFKIRKSR